MREKDSLGGSITDDDLLAPHEPSRGEPADDWFDLTLPLGVWLDREGETGSDRELPQTVTGEPAGALSQVMDPPQPWDSLPSEMPAPNPVTLDQPSEVAPPAPPAGVPDAIDAASPSDAAPPSPPTSATPASSELPTTRAERSPAPFNTLRDIASRVRTEGCTGPIPPPSGIAADPELLRPFEPAEPPMPASETIPVASERNWRPGLRTAVDIAKKVLIGYAAVVSALILLYRFVDPPFSTLTAFHRLLGRDVHQVWVPIEQISPALVRSVIASEDGRFCSHWGIDPGAVREAIARAKGGLPRGASTISMQVAKNMFLWPSKSYVRKAIEVPVTLAMELVWPKRRILEIYLNVAEWGPGVFGAEAAAQHHFKKSAADLNGREAALLAATLPNPIRRAAGAPGPATSRKASVVQGRARAEAGTADCVLSTLQAPAARPAKGTQPAKGAGATPGL